MSGYLIQVGATAMCPHAGQINAVPGSPRVTLGGAPATSMADTFLVAGCPFMMGPVPSPCLKVQWLVPATRVMIGGQPAILQSSTGLCNSPAQIPQGPPNVVVAQLRVKGM
jgi:hypothetical protein